MGIKKDIRSRLKSCGDCVNCKLVVWESFKGFGIEADRYMTAAGNDTHFFIVRCAWLKNAVAYPLFLTDCEGKKSYRGDETS